MMSSRCFCSRKYFLDSPSKCNTMPESANRNTCLDRPICQAQRFSVVCKQVSATGISHLLSLCCPAAIAWLVVAVIVNPVNRVGLTWLSSHVIQEVLKRLTPSATDRNASPSVSVIPWRVRVGASLNHPMPSRILSGIRFSAIATSTLAVFDSLVVFDRIIRRHGSTPLKLDCDRAAWRPQSSGCSHYYATSGWGRQHVA